MSDMTEREKRVRDRAQELWEQAGSPLGQENDFFEQAEAQIEEEDQSPTNPE